MDEIGSKALLLGVGIFVTLIIVTVIVLEFFQIEQIYKNVGEVDISFESQFDELNKFRDNNIFNGLDVKNYIKKYADNKSIEVCLQSMCSDIDINSINYATEYTANLEEIPTGYRIIFWVK